MYVCPANDVRATTSAVFTSRLSAHARVLLRHNELHTSDLTPLLTKVVCTMLLDLQRTFPKISTI